MKPIESLRKDIGRALIQAHFSLVGRDYAYYMKSTGSGQHVAVPAFEKPPVELVSEMSDLTNGVLGVISNPDFQWTVSHIRELPERWESGIDRSILESYVLHVTSAFEWFLDVVAGGKNLKDFVQKFPKHAVQLNELRETRNCLLHNAGEVDERYLKSVGVSKRAELGDILPLTWTYAYEATLLVMRFGKDATGV